MKSLREINSIFNTIGSAIIWVLIITKGIEFVFCPESFNTWIKIITQ